MIEFGLIPEFVGRLPVISRTDKLSKENLIRILEEPRDALIKQYKKILKMDNVDINFSSDAIVYIAELVHGFGTGARGLRRVMEMILDNYLFNIDEFKNKKINISRDEVESILTHKKVL